MSIISRFRSAAALRRKLEETLYECVANELSNGEKKAGLWAQALAETDYDEKKAKAKYITLRVQSLKDELLFDGLRRELEDQSETAEKKELEEALRKADAWLRNVGVFGKP